MDVYYNVAIQMSGIHKVTDEVVRDTALELGCSETDVDERETYSVVFFIKTTEMPSQFLNHIRRVIFDKVPFIHYIDVIYRWETEMNCDRYVVWQDGNETYYTGKTIFVEDK